MSVIFGMVHLSDQFLILLPVFFVDYLVKVFSHLDTFQCLEILLMLTVVFFMQGLEVSLRIFSSI